MRTFKNITTALLVAVILFAGCKNPAEDVEIIVNTDIFKSPTLIQFVNAKKGAVGPQDFNVTITGPNADLVRTSTGGKSFKATSGLLNLLLDRGANPTPQNPVKFTVVANAPGFAPVFQDVIITSASDPSLYRVEVAEYANPAAGSAAIVAPNLALSNGTTNSDITIATSTNAGVAQKTDITIPSGTGFKDASGATLAGSQLEARVVFSGTSTNGISPAIPGGNLTRNVIGTNGQPIATGAYFVPAGSVTIDMFAGGKEVKTFTKPVIVDMEVNPTMINPTTNQSVKAGETIPMWSLNDETGQWKAEGNATLEINSVGKLIAKMPITHLSSWITSYIFDPLPIIEANPVFSNVSPFCSGTVTINRPASSSAETFSISGGLLTERVTFNSGETTKTVNLSTFRTSNNSITVRPHLSFLGTASTYVNTVLTQAIDCGSTATFTFTAPPAAEVIDADVYVRVKCSGKDLTTGINAIVTITPLNAPADEARVYNLKQGKGSGQIVNGTTYKIVASVDGKSYTSQFTASKTNFQLPTGFDLVGTAVFTNGRLAIDGLVTKTDCN